MYLKLILKWSKTFHDLATFHCLQRLSPWNRARVFLPMGSLSLIVAVTANMKVIKSQRNGSTQAISQRGPLWKRPCFKTAPIKSKKLLSCRWKNSGGSRGGAREGPLILDHEAQCAPKKIFWRLTQPPAYLKVWSRHWKKLRFSFIPYCLPKIT